MALEPAEAIQALQNAIVNAGNASGGWGYYPAHDSRVEPTAWALLTLSSQPPRDRVSTMAGGRAFLSQALISSGLLADRHQASPNLAVNGLVALLWTAHPDLTDHSSLDRLDTAIASQRGVQLSDAETSRQNNALQGWPWIDGTFSWVEPTSWCLLALKKSTRREETIRSRIDEAERLLTDRACQSGGWNYGNSNMMGQDLRPYIPTTALGLLAMQDRRRDPVVVKALEHLQANRLTEISGLALALATTCLHVFGMPTDDLRQHLLTQWGRTRFLGNVQVSAMALYALTIEQHGGHAFKL